MKTPAIQYNKELDLKRLRFIYQNLEGVVPKNGKILDVGCGNGIISMHLGMKGYSVLGIDISEKAIQTANSHNHEKNVKFKVISAENLVAQGHQYDAVICSEVLEHLNQPSSLLKTLHACLKDQGVMIVTVPNGYGPREVFVTKPMLKLRRKNGLGWEIVGKVKSVFGYKGSTIQSDADNMDHIQFFDIKSLTHLAKENNFQISKFGKTNFIDDVFPFSFLANRIKILQRFDCFVADILPYQFSGGFNTVWKKNK